MIEKKPRSNKSKVELGPSEFQKKINELGDEATLEDLENSHNNKSETVINNDGGAFEVGKDSENIFGYGKLNRVLSEEEKAVILEKEERKEERKNKLSKLEREEKERRGNNKKAKEEEVAEKKSKSFFGRIFSKETAKGVGNFGKEFGLRFTGFKVFSAWKENRNVKKDEEAMKSGEVPAHITDLIDTIKNGDSSEENKIKRIELKNKLREVKESNPEQYKKAVEVLFKSRNKKEEIKKEVLENIDNIYTKEKREKKQQLVKESINTALTWSGAVAGGAFAYNTVILRTINNLTFAGAKQLENKDGELKLSELKNAFSKAKESWDNKGKVQKLASVGMGAALGYMLYNGYDMNQKGTIDDYNTLLGKLGRGELPYYSNDNGSIFDKFFGDKSQGDIQINSKSEILHTISKNEGLESVLRDEKFLESIGAKGLSAHETDNLVANLAKRVGSVEGLEEFKNLQEGGTVDLNNLRQLVEKDIEIGGKTFGSLVERADALDASTTAEGVPQLDLQGQEVAGAGAGESGGTTTVETGSVERVNSGFVVVENGKVEFDINSLKERLTLINQGGLVDGKYTIQSGDSLTKIIENKFLANIGVTEANGWTKEQIYNITGNLLRRMKDGVTEGHFASANFSCNMGVVENGVINMSKMLDMVTSEFNVKGVGSWDSMLHRAIGFHPNHNLLDKIGDPYLDDCGGKPCGERVVRHIVEKPAAVAKTVVHTETHIPVVEKENFTKEELGMERGITYTETSRVVATDNTCEIADGEHTFSSRSDAEAYRRNNPFGRDLKVDRYYDETCGETKWQLIQKNGGGGNDSSGGSGGNSSGGGRSNSSGGQSNSNSGDGPSSGRSNSSGGQSY